MFLTWREVTGNPITETRGISFSFLKILSHRGSLVAALAGTLFSFARRSIENNIAKFNSLNSPLGPFNASTIFI